MYLKIVYTNPAFPKSSAEHLFECSKVFVRKDTAHSKEVFNETLDGILESEDFDFIGTMNYNRKSNTFLMIFMTDKQGKLHKIMVIESKVYAMGEDGKTVDKWECE